MENTPLSHQEQQDAVKVYQIAKAFISSHYVRDMQQRFGEMFALYAASECYASLPESTRTTISITYMDMIGLTSDLARLIPDAEVMERLAA